jgi:SAM-dependent methyltransferase
MIPATGDSPRLYSELAGWWPLLSGPSEYVEEAKDLLPLLLGSWDATRLPTLLELGAGGGSLAHNLKDHFVMTLTDRSPDMLAVSSGVNPECEHIAGDMTSLDLGRQFDRVLVHDAIMYATEPDAVRATLRTVARHCRAGGIVVVVPDCVRENFAPGTEMGGEDGPDGRGLRYLEWTWDPVCASYCTSSQADLTSCPIRCRPLVQVDYCDMLNLVPVMPKP